MTIALTRSVLLAAASVCLIAALPLRAQQHDPLPPGWQPSLQAGFAWSTLVDVAPVDPDMAFSSRRGAVYSLRMSRWVAGPVSGFAEGGTAARGSRFSAPGESELQYRTRWFEGIAGVNLAARCFAEVCPSLDVGAALGYNRQADIADLTGRPVSTSATKSWETSAVVGGRVMIPRLRRIAVVARHQRGLTHLPEDDTDARNRSWILMAAFPLNR